MSSSSYEITKPKMQKCIDTMKQVFASVRTGQASTSLIQDVTVEVYGQKMPLKNAASITVHDSKTLMVTPWDQNNAPLIDNAIRNADLGLNPRNEGSQLYIPIPEMTAQRRQEMIKLLKKKAEETKIIIRNIRRDTNTHIKGQEKDKSEDDIKTEFSSIQKLTDKYIDEIEQLTKNKQHDIETL